MPLAIGPGIGIPFGGASAWWPAGATMAIDFANNRYFGITEGDITATRASGGTALDLAGNVVSFGNNVMRRTSRGLLVEAAATNLMLRSQALATTWGVFNAGTGSAPTRTNDHALAPDGTTTATRLQLALNGGTTSTDQSVVNQVITITNSTAYTLSFWVRSLSGAPVIRVSLDGVAAFTPFAISAEWQRVTFTGTSSGTSATVVIGIRGGQSPACADSADILVWGVQLETGSVATSYIPTTTTAMTRAFDNVFTPLGAWWNASEGIFVATVRDIPAGSAARTVLAINNGGAWSAGPGFRLRTDSLTAVAAGGNATLASLTGLMSLTRRRLAGGYRTSDTRQSVSEGGANFLSNTTGDYTSTGSSRLQIGALDNTPTDVSGFYIENIAFIPTPGLLAAGATMNPLTVLT